MKLSAAHSFIRWDGRMLTAAQEQIIDALERQRCRQGRVRAVVNITPETAPDVEWLLMRYTQYLRATFLPRSGIMVVDTTRRAATARFGGIRGVRAVRDFVHVCSGTRRYGTRAYNDFQHVLAFNMHLYGRTIPGDPRTADAITNCISSVPDTDGTSIIFTGHVRKRSRRYFSTYYAYTAGRGPDHTYIVIDSLCPPPLRRIRAISRTEWRRRARLGPRAPTRANVGTHPGASAPTRAGASPARAGGATPTRASGAATSTSPTPIAAATGHPLNVGTHPGASALPEAWPPQHAPRACVV